MLYCVVLKQAASYRFIQRYVVFIHSQLFSSSVQTSETIKEGETNTKDTLNGGDRYVSSSHSNVTLWFTVTLLDGRTDSLRVMPAEK